MNKATARWIGSTYQCRSCSERVTSVEDDFLCSPCHHLRRLFPAGETNSKRRGHAFLTRTMVRDMPGVYSTEDVEMAAKRLVAHYFVGGCDWYVAEFDRRTGDAFGYADLSRGEWGYFNLPEMEQTVVDGWLVIERDLGFQPTTAGELGIA